MTNHSDDEDLINSVFTHMHVICNDIQELLQQQAVQPLFANAALY
jgi:hypothetical protein